MQPFLQDATPPREQPFLLLKGKFLSKNAHKYLVAGLAMVGTYDSCTIPPPQQWIPFLKLISADRLLGNIHVAKKQLIFF